jgi:hypothetical protein
VLIVYFCVNAGYGGTRLGACWAILEERYPEYRSPVRNPYATIAYRAVGRWGRYTKLSVLQLSLLNTVTSVTSLCFFVLVLTLIMCLFIYLHI